MTKEKVVKNVGQNKSESFNLVGDMVADKVAQTLTVRVLGGDHEGKVMRVSIVRKGDGMFTGKQVMADGSLGAVFHCGGKKNICKEALAIYGIEPSKKGTGAVNSMLSAYFENLPSDAPAPEADKVEAEKELATSSKKK